MGWGRRRLRLLRGSKRKLNSYVIGKTIID